MVHVLYLNKAVLKKEKCHSNTLSGWWLQGGEVSHRTSGSCVHEPTGELLLL